MIKVSEFTTLALSSEEYTMDKLKALYIEKNIDITSEKEISFLGISAYRINVWARIWLDKNKYSYAYPTAFKQFREIIKKGK